MTAFVASAGSLVDRIKINEMRRAIQANRMFWIKRRRITARWVIAGANVFFRLARAPIRVIADVATWQRWEVDCFARLHGERFRAAVEGPSAVAAEELPGVNLTVFLDNGTITPAMAAAAGRELHRAHRCGCEEFAGPWSHGDPHAGNFIFEEAHQRARLIDFEVMHAPGLPAIERHADDLLVFLQDLVGRIRADLWMPCALAFLSAYGRPEVRSVLLGKLTAPRGIARVWWIVRTNYRSPADLRRRLEALRSALQSVALPAEELDAQPSEFLTATHSSTT